MLSLLNYLLWPSGIFKKHANVCLWPIYHETKSRERFTMKVFWFLSPLPYPLPIPSHVCYLLSLCPTPARDFKVILILISKPDSWFLNQMCHNLLPQLISSHPFLSIQESLAPPDTSIFEGSEDFSDFMNFWALLEELVMELGVTSLWYNFVQS